MRVLGVDPGLTRCGLGVVSGELGRPPVMLGVGVIRTASSLDVPNRLVAIETGLQEWILEYHPDVVAIERVFAQHNVTTVAGTAQAAGVAMLVAARAGVRVATHTPSEVKAAITGSGSADKAQVASMVMRVLKLPDKPKPADAADALALAVCQLWRGAASDRLATAVAQARQRQYDSETA